MAPFRPPAEPAVRELIRLASSTATTRRALLTGALGAGAAGALAACAPPPPPAGGAAKVELPTDRSATEKVVRWSNWDAYMDKDDSGNHYPTLEAFEKKSGIKVTYSVDVDDNDSYVNKVAPQLRAKQDIKTDIFVLTDWMANRVIREGLVQPLELIQMPNAGNLLEPLKEVSFDPGRQYSLTWQTGFAGIGYNRRKVGRELKTIEDLWAPNLKGRVSVLSEMRDTVGLIMQSQGVDLGKAFTKDQFQAGLDEVDKRISDGNIRRVKGNS